MGKKLFIWFESKSELERGMKKRQYPFSAFTTTTYCTKYEQKSVELNL